MIFDQEILFQESNGPISDWFIATDDSQIDGDLLISLGARAHKRDGHRLFEWRLPFSRSVILNGSAVCGTQLVVGPAPAPRIDSTPRGCYELLDFTGDVTKITIGPFGARPVFHGRGLASNRLHLIALFCKELDKRAALSCIFTENTFSSQFNTRRTPLMDVNLLLAHEGLHVGRSISVVCEDLSAQYDRIGPAEYHALVEQGAEEIKDNFRALIARGDSLNVALSGGRDSRINLAALVALKSVDAVRFHTQDIGEDAPVASGLVHKYGGRYGSDSAGEVYVRSLELCHNHRRTHKYGSYHLVSNADYRLSFVDPGPGSTHVSGSFGELYRGFYQRPSFCGDFDLTDASRENLRKFLKRISSHMLKDWPEQFRFVRSPLVETLDLLPGLDIDQKLDSHYLNFRSRFHFGLPMSTRITSDGAFSPLLSPALLRAARGLPSHVKNSGQIIFDVTRSLCEEIAYLPYDKPWTSDFSRSEYYRPSVFDGRRLSLEPHLEIIEKPRRTTPVRVANIDRFELSAEGCLKNLERIKEGRLRRAADPFVERRIEAFIRNRRGSVTTWYSRLQAIADFGREDCAVSAKRFTEVPRRVPA